MPEIVRLPVRVQPRSIRSEIVAVSEGRLKIRTMAPAAEGRANRDVAKQLAKAFGVPRSRISLKTGVTGRLKTFVVEDPAVRPEWLQEIDFR